jgi:glucose/mannose-6-phosphate isomerase
MYGLDKTNFKKYLIKFPSQIRESKKLFKDGFLNISDKKINNIIYIGMGGSAIAGDILNDVFFNDLKIPMNVVRGYEIPGFCNKNSLVMASSYSGNTEETLSSAEKAHQAGAQIVALTSGGELLKMAQTHNWSYLTIPEGFPPRQAFGYLFFPALYVLNQFSNKPISERKISEISRMVELIVNQNDEETAPGKILAKDLAINLQNKIPIIYSTEPYFKAVALRWRTQFQENSKSMAFSNVIPEMNHNEIVGWEMENRCLNNYMVIFLENEICNSRIKARIRLTKNILRDKGIDIVEIYAQGNSLLENIISLVSIGDWVSYYLALLYDKNPAAILNIDYLKSELKKLG